MLKKFLFLFLTCLITVPVFAQDEEVKRTQGSFWQTLIMIGIAIIFFYFILWRPEQKRRKKLERKRSEMKKGDKATAMGIIGTIDQVKEQTVIMKMIDGSKIEFHKGAITEVSSKEEMVEEQQRS